LQPETENVLAAATDKRKRKRCDWIIANDVSGDVMGGDSNEIHLITEAGTESWPAASKQEVAKRLANRIADALK
jgi:phosphopantothenoylcysteine decarboxylase/phosphopantothenate--cysteine ligase